MAEEEEKEDQRKGEAVPTEHEQKDASLLQDRPIRREATYCSYCAALTEGRSYCTACGRYLRST